MSTHPQPRLRVVDGDHPTEPGEDPVSEECAESGARGRGTFAEAFRRDYAFAYRMLGVYGVEPALLDDAAQEVFLVVHRRWDDYDGRRAFRNWLVGIVRRVASTYRRAGRRRRARIQQLPQPAPPTSVELRLVQREELEQIDAFIARLGSRHREAFVLSELEGMTAPEIAEIVGVKLNTVYSRIRVARERFRQWDADRRKGQRPQQGGGDRAQAQR